MSALVEIKFRPWTGKASLEIQVGDDVSPRFRMRAALEIVVKEALAGKRTGAVLTGADLTDAVLTRAVLTRAVLTGAVLNTFKNDFWSILLKNKPEVPGLIAALREGHVDGTTYHGACACLVGTIANVRGVNVDSLECNSSRPAERWFLMIRKGDKPGDATGGGFAAGKALEWAEEFCSYAGVTIPEAVQS